jgi:hypothetical protein
MNSQGLTGPAAGPVGGLVRPGRDARVRLWPLGAASSRVHQSPLYALTETETRLWAESLETLRMSPAPVE